MSDTEWYTAIKVLLKACRACDGHGAQVLGNGANAPCPACGDVIDGLNERSNPIPVVDVAPAVGRYGL